MRKRINADARARKRGVLGRIQFETGVAGREKRQRMIFASWEIWCSNYSPILTGLSAAHSTKVKSKVRGGFERKGQTYHIGLAADQSREIIFGVGLGEQLCFKSVVVVAEQKSRRVCLVKSDIVESSARFCYGHRIPVDAVPTKVSISIRSNHEDRVRVRTSAQDCFWEEMLAWSNARGA